MLILNNSTTYSSESFFARIQSFFSKELATRDIIVGCVKDIIGIELQPGSVSLKGVTVNINCTANVKSVIFTKKSKIISRIKEELSSQGIKVAIADLR